MQITMRDATSRSVLELSKFLVSSEAWQFEAENQSETYRWVQKELVGWEYLQQGKKERGVIRGYLER